MPSVVGVTVDFAVSPRIITVPDPLVTISVQDLIDTIRDIEDEPSSMSYTALASAGGKEALGTGDLVGITLKLLDARVAFEDRGGPSFVQCTIDGGNLVAVDTSDVIIDPIETTDFTQVVLTQSSSATLTPNKALTVPQFLALK